MSDAFEISPRVVVEGQPVMLGPRFPHASRYLESLQEGLGSFPHCEARGEVFEAVRHDFPGIAERATLPEPVAAFFEGYYTDRWMPEVVGQAVNLMVRDAGVGTEAEFLDWTYGVSERLFQRPFFKHLMKLMSPTLVVMGSAQRWKAVHRGSELSSTKVTHNGSRMQSAGILTFPEGLFPELFLRSLPKAFQAGLDGARGRGAAVELSKREPGQAEYSVSWNA